MNKVILSGRITKELEPKFSKNDKSYIQFTIAVDRPMVKDKTDFINCVCFGKLADYLYKYSGKGKKVLIVGQLEVSTYEKENKKYNSFNVIADNIEILEWKEKTTDTENIQENKTDEQIVEELFPF